MNFPNIVVGKDEVIVKDDLFYILDLKEGDQIELNVKT